MAEGHARNVVPLLNGGNYARWTIKVRAILMRDDVWDTVSDDLPEATARDDRWKKRNNKALAHITLALEDDQLVHIGHLDNAKEVWDKLKKVHARSTFGSQLYLRRKLYGIKYSTGSMQTHINAMLEIVGLLKGAGTTVSDEEVVAVMLCSLPVSYSGLVTALEGRDSADLTIEYVAGKMLDEHQRRTEDKQVQDDDSKVLQVSSGQHSSRTGSISNSHKGARPKGTKFKKETRECHFCKRQGHLKKDCRMFQQQQSGSERQIDRATVCDQGQQRQVNHVSLKARHYAMFAGTGHWFVDSGASSHMTNRKSFFTDFKDYQAEVFQADGAKIDAVGIGTGWLRCMLPSGEVQMVLLNDVLFVPKLEANLLSVRKVIGNRCKVVFEGSICQVLQNKRVILQAAEDGTLFRVQQAPTDETAQLVNTSACLHKWHRRMGHRDPAAIRKMDTEKLVSGLDVQKCDKTVHCDHCTKGKLAQLPFQPSKTRATRPLELLHSDLCGPLSETPSGNRYLLTLIDDHSRYGMIKLVKTKDQVPGVIKDSIAMLQTRFGRKPAIIRSDNGGEYVNKELDSFFRKEGIEHQLTVPYTPQQNGVAERRNRTLTEMARCMLLDSGLPKRYWGEAILTANYLQNRLPSRAVEKTPYEHFWGKTPDLAHIRVFGSKVFSTIPKQKRKKLDDVAREGVLVGYDDVTKGYRIADTRTDAVWISRSVRIVESEELEGVPSLQIPVDSQESDFPSKWDSPPPPEKEEQTSEGSNPNAEGEKPPTKPLSPVVPRVSQRSTKGIPPRRLSYKVEKGQVREPDNWDDMCKLPQHERQQWIAAAREEMASFQEHQVWELVNLPEGKSVVTAKWVFKAKLDAAGRVHTRKARLVARGFTQKFGSDYDETFAPVVRHETVRMLFAVAASKGLNIRQLDVRSAYLNGDLKEEIYLEQPQGFMVAGQENKVLRLYKSIYGLKQSARCWNMKAAEALAKLGFQQGQADQCLYTRKEQDGSTTYVLLYVDDMLVAGSTPEITKEVGEKLNGFFTIRDLGDVSHYLGIQVEREADGSILLSQRNKIVQMLEEHDLLEPKPAYTPMETGYLANSMDESPRLPNNRKYRQAIGSLLYLSTVSRPDISLAVGLLARKVEDPTERDWKSVKHVMRFLGTTIGRKLRLSSDSEVRLLSYVDADWAGDRRDRKSTSGYVFQLGHSTIAWCSRKQQTVAMSSTEAEYVSASHACKELLWLRQLLEDMRIPAGEPTVIYEDNQGCIRLTESERSGARTKHIDVCHHQLRDLREKGVIELKYCPTEDMMADILTKPLSKELFRRFSEQLELRE